MIDPVIASTAVSLLSPFLIKAGEKFAEKAVDGLAEKTGGIYQLLKEKLSGDEYAGLTLLRLEEDPDSEGRKSALENVIKEKMEEDGEFASQLTELINEVKKAGAKNVISSGERSVAIGGDVKSSEINTGNIINYKD